MEPVLVGNSEVTDLPRKVECAESLGDFLSLPKGIGPVQQEDVQPVSAQAFQASWNIAAAASATAAVACIGTWQTDFRDNLPKIDVPVLVVQGYADRILPFPNTGKRLPGLITDMELVVIDGGPHAITWTHADQVNRALLDFLA